MPSDVAKSTVASQAAASESVASNDRTPPSAARASATARTGGPATVAETAFESIRPSSAQIASAAAQSPVAFSVSVVPSPESGRTRTAMRRFFPASTRFASIRRPFSTSSAPAPNAVSFSPSNSSPKTISNPNRLDPSCAAGRPANSAVSGGTSTTVPVASPSATAAPDAFDSVTENVSSSSAAVSWCAATSTVASVSPAANVSVPEAAS